MARSHRAKYWTQHTAVRLGFGTLGLLPFRARTAFCTALSQVAFAFLFAATVRANLRSAYGADVPKEQRRAIRRANARAIGRFLSEIVEYRKRPRATAQSLVTTDETLRHLDDALARKRGAVVVTPHFGNWELFPAHLATRGYTGAVVGRRAANPRLADLVESMRTAAGVLTLDALGSARPMLRVLEEGGVVGLLPDLDSKRVAGVFVPFFGRPAYTPTGPAALAVAAKAPLVTSYMLPDGARYRLVFEPAIDPDPNAPRREEVERLTRAWSERFEARIRANPQAWVWMHDRWATTPEKADERRRRRARATAPTEKDTKSA